MRGFKNVWRYIAWTRMHAAGEHAWILDLAEKAEQVGLQRVAVFLDRIAARVSSEGEV